MTFVHGLFKPQARRPYRPAAVTLGDRYLLIKIKALRGRLVILARSGRPSEADAAERSSKLEGVTKRQT